MESKPKGRACCPQRAAPIQTTYSICADFCHIWRRAEDSTPYLEPRGGAPVNLTKVRYGHMFQHCGKAMVTQR